MKLKLLFCAALLGAATFVYSADKVSLEQNSQNDDNSSLQQENTSINFDDTKEAIEGIVSVVEGTNLKISKLDNRLSDLEIVVKNSEFENMKKDIQELKKELKIINSKLEANLSKKSKNSNVVSGKSKKLDKDLIAKIESEDKKKIISDAENFYKQKKYAESETRFKYLISKNYKPAMSNFMMGEIYYSKKRYAEAIKCYQKSISHSQKTDFMPKLLYHTAISFDKIGDTKSANKFYSILKASYSATPEAKASPKRK